MAHKVPKGILLFGSLSSPDIFAPAIIPVAAGKNTAKTIQKLLPLKSFSGDPWNEPKLNASWAGICMEPLYAAATIEIRDSTMTTIITYWVLMARLALTY